MTTHVEEEIMNPLVPTALDGVLTAVSIVALFLAFSAFVALMRSQTIGGWRLFAWAFVVLLVPIVGPATWFVAQHRERSIESRGGRSDS